MAKFKCGECGVMFEEAAINVVDDGCREPGCNGLVRIESEVGLKNIIGIRLVYINQNWNLYIDAEEFATDFVYEQHGGFYRGVDKDTGIVNFFSFDPDTQKDYAFVGGINHKCIAMSDGSTREVHGAWSSRPSVINMVFNGTHEHVIDVAINQISYNLTVNAAQKILDEWFGQGQWCVFPDTKWVSADEIAYEIVRSEAKEPGSDFVGKIGFSDYTDWVSYRDDLEKEKLRRADVPTANACKSKCVIEDPFTGLTGEDMGCFDCGQCDMVPHHTGCKIIDNNPAHQHDDGTWHWYDETWCYETGPYFSEHEAADALKEYMNETLHPAVVNPDDQYHLYVSDSDRSVVVCASCHEADVVRDLLNESLHEDDRYSYCGVVERPKGGCCACKEGEE